MSSLEFDAYDYQADQSFTPAYYLLEGSADDGWRVSRDGASVLELGPGFRPLRSVACGRSRNVSTPMMIQRPRAPNRSSLRAWST